MSRSARPGHIYYRPTIGGNARVHLGDAYYASPGFGRMTKAVVAGNFITQTIGYFASFLFDFNHPCHQLAEEDSIVPEHLAQQAARIGDHSLAVEFIEASICADSLRSLNSKGARKNLFKRWEMKEDPAIAELQDAYVGKYRRVLSQETGLVAEISFHPKNVGEEGSKTSELICQGNETNALDHQRTLPTLKSSDDLLGVGAIRHNANRNVPEQALAIIDPKKENSPKTGKRVKMWPFKIDRSGQPGIRDWRYGRQENAAQYFVPGRVFAAPWDRRCNRDIIPPFVSRLRTLAGVAGILYFVAVLPMATRSCYCLPIIAYNEQGKPCFDRTQKNTDAHALLYAPQNCEVRCHNGERKYEMDPIKEELSPASQQDRLSYVHGLNLTDAFLIDCELDVEDIGMVEKEDSQRLMKSWLNLVLISISSRDG